MRGGKGVSTRPERRPFVLILVFFFVSGAGGLLYQVVWTRQLVLLFGATAYAVGTVLSVFFLGLGAGSLIGGRLADRARAPLRVYGFFEIAIGLWAAFLIVLLRQVGPGVAAALGALGGSRLVDIALRGALTFALLIVPVTLMGATLPLLAQFVTTETRTRGLRIGALYSVNTLGAVAGCALTGFLLLATLGYARTTLVGVAGNGIIGVAAIVCSRRWTSGLHDLGPAEVVAEPDPEPAQRTVACVVLVAFGISGFCALALEVLWSRLLVLVFTGTTYAFTTMLVTLLAGLVAGSAVAAAVVDRVRTRAYGFGVIEILIGLSCLAMLGVFAGLPERLAALEVELGFDWARVTRAKFVLAASALFMPAFLFGATFPFVVNALTGARRRLGRDVGLLYAVNTFGGVLGSLAGGFLLIPCLGVQSSIVVLSITLVAVGVAVVLVGDAPSRMAKPFATAAGVVMLVVLARQFGTMDASEALNVGYVPERDRVIHYREGVEANVAVSEPRNSGSDFGRTLWINGVQATSSIEKGVLMNRFQGILPLLFDRDPKRVLFMCFGSGVTAGTLGLYDFERIDTVEIAADVIETAPLFGDVNFDVAHNPKVRFIVNDGRNFLLTTDECYDVISFEPMPLALAGVSTFYTREYYEQCRAHLTQDGIVSQWVPLHSLDTDLVRSLVHTFVDVFPECCAWFVNADLFLSGSTKPLHIDYRRARERLEDPVIKGALDLAGLCDLPEVLTCFFMGKSNTADFARNGQVLTDDRPWAEFVAPKLVNQRRVADAIEAITPFYESPAAMLDWGDMDEAARAGAEEAIARRSRARASDLIGLKHYYGGLVSDTPAAVFRKSLDIDPKDCRAQYYLACISLALAHLEARDNAERAAAILEEAIRYAPERAELHLALADVWYEIGAVERACPAYAAHLELGGVAPRARERAGALTPPGR
ncbi:MAG TPA: fused MFS/spermidine synthase [Candidatus Hydrogenedentes bacterium]|nr:fused MFS/spermidine synthase [Candidatus Hydrogenedentota bacterium]HPG65999.1 fused MFS/spermidine synthase [Candidatus Hydrogenedentota bacterium]